MKPTTANKQANNLKPHPISDLNEKSNTNTNTITKKRQTKSQQPTITNITSAAVNPTEQQPATEQTNQNKETTVPPSTMAKQRQPSEKGMQQSDPQITKRQRETNPKTNAICKPNSCEKSREKAEEKS